MKSDDQPAADAALNIAVVGYAGRFPGARDADKFWENLCSGVESITFFTEEELERAGTDRATLSDPNFVKAAPVLEGVDMFDASLFGYSPREARGMDPQHRLLLECAWEAMEHAGYDAAKYGGSVGVFAGAAMNTYLLFSGLLPQFSKEYLLTLIGNDKDFLATRVSYKLNLTGPSVTVQTACSTSLVAVHMARQSLLSEECDMALAGGVSVRVPQRAGYFYQEGSVFSPDGHCRTFDAGARGTIFGSGVGVVVLKRLADALADGDCIHAVIVGSAVNNDGSSKVEFTAPSVVGQSVAVVEAIANAGINAETITYVEAHGTGTQLGDPIEVAALTKAFRAYTQKKGFCAIGSAKPNIGHMDAAAGVAGLIKTVLSLKHKTIPPLLHFERPNPEIDFADSPYYVNTTLTEWGGASLPRRAGINSLGMGGTNAFIVLEEAPPAEASGPSRPHQLLLLSAKTAPALDAARRRLAEHLMRRPGENLADVAYTLQVGRRDLDHRLAVVCRDASDAAAVLTAPDESRVATARRRPVSRDLVFLFSGQGTQYVNMGRELYQTEPEFRERIDRCADLLRPHLSLDLRDILYPGEAAQERAARELDQTYLTQPALFAVEYALAGLLMSWGLRPVAMTGHSLGEYVAACLAGVFSLGDALALVAARGRLMQELPGGSMLAVALTEEAIRPLLDDKLSLAAVNGPSLCTVAGERGAVAALEERLSAGGVSCRRLRTSHAFHSAMMEPILGDFAERVGRVDAAAPRTPFLSNVTGTWITAQEAASPDYWARHIRGTVRFADGLRELLKEPSRILLEVGPGQTLGSLTRAHPSRAAGHVVLSSMRPPRDTQSDVALLLNTIGQVWLSGFEIDWAGFYANERRARLPLPPYPFQRQSYWIAGTELSGHAVPGPYTGDAAGRRETADAGLGDSAAPPARGWSPHTAYVAPRTPLEESVARVWQEVLGIPQIGIDDDFFQLGGTSILITAVIRRLNEAFKVDLSALNLLESPTVAGLAGCIEAVRGAARAEVGRDLEREATPEE